MLIDTHTHLYLDKFQDDIDEVIARAKESGVEQMFLPNIDLATMDDVFSLHAKYPEQCLPMVGLHPCSVKEDYKDQLQGLSQYLDRDGVVAVGEIGMDLYWDKTFQEQQVEAFHVQIDWALEKNLPIVIHARNAMRECIDVVRDRQKGQLRGVFHCFDQTIEDARDIIDLGFYLGIGGVLTFKKSKLPAVMKEVDLQHIILETDSPFLSPSPYRGKRNESSYVKYVADKMSDIKEISLKNVAAITTQNARELFKV